MRRTTISLPDDLADLLLREAKRLGTSVSEVVRGALRPHLGLRDRPRKLPFVALGRSGTRHTARRAEEILASEWNDDRGR